MDNDLISSSVEGEGEEDGEGEGEIEDEEELDAGMDEQMTNGWMDNLYILFKILHTMFLIFLPRLMNQLLK